MANGGALSGNSRKCRRKLRLPSTPQRAFVPKRWAVISSLLTSYQFLRQAQAGLCRHLSLISAGRPWSAVTGCLTGFLDGTGR
jgi:hypothetical protein